MAISRFVSDVDGIRIFVRPERRDVCEMCVRDKAIRKATGLIRVPTYSPVPTSPPLRIRTTVN